MQQHGLNAESVGRRTGLGKRAAEALLEHGAVDLEISGPIDELLDGLDDGTERSRSARALVVPDHAPAVVPVVANIGALNGASVTLEVAP
jgi:hypothetical protein